jgi:hypothetical protein
MEDFSMNRFLLALVLSCAAAAASGHDVVVTTTTVISAQDQAEECARLGVLKHCRVLHGRREGIGFSTVSPTEAEKSACFYQDAMRGRYRIVERGHAYSHTRRGWFAVLRYSN